MEHDTVEQSRKSEEEISKTFHRILREKEEADQLKPGQAKEMAETMSNMEIAEFLVALRGPIKYASAKDCLPNDPIFFVSLVYENCSRGGDKNYDYMSQKELQVELKDLLCELLQLKEDIGEIKAGEPKRLMETGTNEEIEKVLGLRK